VTAISYECPVTQPRKIICIGLNYAQHTAESGYAQPSYPTFFLRVATSLTAHEAPISRTALSDSLDYEGELALVIGRGGKYIEPAAALDHVAGYSIFNDASVREYQFKTPQWTIGKNFDSTGAFGPCLVTPDELPIGARGLRLETRLNGSVVQSANTSDMLFDVAHQISLLSEAMTLEVGDVIATGTPSGIGWTRTPRIVLRPGDKIEVEIEGIGILSNRIIDEAPRVQDGVLAAGGATSA
jgi:2-keto-4-pentenoate hydratase/2-oxohepta-3-ene-1,7-dioic acid hydratase in catechol pathway